MLRSAPTLSLAVPTGLRKWTGDLGAGNLVAMHKLQQIMRINQCIIMCRLSYAQSAHNYAHNLLDFVQAFGKWQQKVRRIRSPCHVFLWESNGVLRNDCFSCWSVSRNEHGLVSLQTEDGLLLERVQLERPERNISPKVIKISPKVNLNSTQCQL